MLIPPPTIFFFQLYEACTEEEEEGGRRRKKGWKEPFPSSSLSCSSHAHCTASAKETPPPPSPSSRWKGGTSPTSSFPHLPSLFSFPCRTKLLLPPPPPPQPSFSLPSKRRLIFLKRGEKKKRVKISSPFYPFSLPRVLHILCCGILAVFLHTFSCHGGWVASLAFRLQQAH